MSAILLPQRRIDVCDCDSGMILAGTADDALHICDAVECKLPAEDWFESNKKKQSRL